MIKVTVDARTFDAVYAALPGALRPAICSHDSDNVATLNMDGIALVRGVEGPEHFKFEPPPLLNGTHAIPLLATWIPYERLPIPGEFKVTCET